MSNILNLKGVKLLAIIVLAIAVLATFGMVAVETASADCSIVSTLRVGSKGDQVKCLQDALGGLTSDGSFGPKTKVAVMAFQTAHNLVADGVFGPKSLAAWTSSMGMVMGVTYPAGCMGATGYSSSTGLACYAIYPALTLPAGCTSTAGFSPTTGASCATGVSTSYPAGCTSASGFSSTTGASCATGAVNNQTGPVSVSLSSDNPASGYIINNQATADLAHFTFTGTGTINSVTLQRTGISNQNTLDNVYLFDGNARLTDGFSFNNVGVLTMNSLGIAVNGSKTISVKADVSSTASDDSTSLGVALVGFTAAGQAATTVSVKGNEMSVGVSSLASVYINSASQTVTGTPSVNAGTSAYTVWSSPIQVNTRAVWLKGANFRMTGSAPADALGNIRLYVDGVAVGGPATMGMITGSNYAMFDFSAAPVSLTTGSHTVDLRADVVKGASFTVTVSLQQASDLVLYDGQVGVNIAVLKSAGVAYTTSGTAVITINAGSASVTVDPTFQAMTNVTGGATNVVIAKFKVHGYGEDVKVSSLDVLPVLTGCTPSCSGLNNLTLYFNGSQVGSSFNWTSAFHQFSLGSQMIIPAGTDSYIEVRADLQTTGSVNYTAGTVSATLNAGSGNGQGQTSHTSLNFPSADKAGTSLTIQTGTLSVSKSSFANTTSNPNTTNVKIGEFTLQNQSTSESVRVTSLAVSLFTCGISCGSAVTALSSSSVPPLTNFSNLKTSETSGSGSQPIQPAATNTFSVDFTIAPNATKTIAVYADTGATVASNTVIAKLVVTSLGSSSNVSISQNGNATAVSGQTITLVAATVAAPTLVSSSSTAAQYVAAAGGATNATKATFNVGATNGSATISELKFAVRGSATVSALNTVSSISVGGVSAPVVTATTNSTTLNDSGGISAGDLTVVVASATGVAAGSVLTIESEDLLVTSAAGGTSLVVTRGFNGTTAATHADALAVSVKNGVAYLTGLNLVVPNGGSGLNIDAYVTYSSVGTSGVASNLVANISLSYIKYSAGGTTRTRCVAGCDDNSAEIAAPTMIVVGSKPTYTMVDSSATLANGLVELGRVVVAADAKGDIKVGQISINVASTGAVNVATGSDNITVKDANGVLIVTKNPTFVVDANDGTNQGTICFDTTTTACASGGAVANAYLITAGQSQTFVIYVTAQGVTGAVGTMALTTSLGTAANTTWYDVAGAGTTALTGASIFNYPTNTSVITN